MANQVIQYCFFFKLETTMRLNAKAVTISATAQEHMKTKFYLFSKQNAP